MNRGGAVPKTAPIGWVFLDSGGCTIRWRRGDPLAYVLEGRQMFHYGTVGVLDTIPVPTSGWTDFAEVRLTGQRWLRQQTNQHHARDTAPPMVGCPVSGGGNGSVVPEPQFTDTPDPMPGWALSHFDFQAHAVDRHGAAAATGVQVVLSDWGVAGQRREPRWHVRGADCGCHRPCHVRIAE